MTYASGLYALPPEVILPSPTKVRERMCSLDEMRRRYIMHVLESVRGHRTRAAKILKIDRKTLHRYLKRYAASEPVT